MKIYFFDNNNESIRVGTVKPKANWYDGKWTAFLFPEKILETQRPTNICLPIARKMLRGTGKRLPKQGSTEIVSIEATFKGE